MIPAGNERNDRYARDTEAAGHRGPTPPDAAREERRVRAFGLDGGGGEQDLRPLRLDVAPFRSIAHVQRMLRDLQGLFGVEYVEVERILGPAVRFRVAYRGLVPFDRRLSELDSERWRLLSATEQHIEIELFRDDGPADE